MSCSGEIFPVHVIEMIVAKQSKDLDHSIHFQDTMILTMKTRCMKHIVREAIVVELHPNNMNRTEYLSLSKSWNVGIPPQHYMALQSRRPQLATP
jgi:hypothetical protein